MNDQLQRFMFDDCDVRGEHVCLSTSYRDVLSSHHYPPAVANLLGEFVAAACLLADSLKFEGSLTLQVRGDGELPLIMAEANDRLEIRAIAQGAEHTLSTDFQGLLGSGQLAITIEPKQGKRYQGIVTLDGDSLARCIETYFAQSEQLGTRLWLAADGQRAAGMMLQELPAKQRNAEKWQHLLTLADTVKGPELLATPAETLLYRLYHQDPVRLFEARAVKFKCSCSRKRIESALLSLGQAELDSILVEQGKIETHCEFCNRRYVFKPQDFGGAVVADDRPTRH